MGRSIAYDLAGTHYSSQAELEHAVKEHLKNAPRDRWFADPLLEDIVNTLHKDVIQAGQHSDGRFMFLSYGEQCRLKLPYAEMYRGGKVLMTWFQPLNERRDVTVYPWKHKTPHSRSDVIGALRAKIAAHIPRPDDYSTYAISGCKVTGYALRYHHVDPSFQAMADSCLALMTSEEIETRFGYEKFKPEMFDVSDAIPNGHPAVLHLIDLHKDNDWIWLCDRHHIDLHHGVAT